MAEAKRQGFIGNDSPVAAGLRVLFNFPQDGFTKTRDPWLDPPARVTGVLKKRFGLTPSWPERWPEKPPPSSPSPRGGVHPGWGVNPFKRFGGIQHAFQMLGDTTPSSNTGGSPQNR